METGFTTRNKLLSALGSGARQSEDAFSEIVSRYGGMVYHTCLRILGDPERAEDATQASFLVLVLKASTVRQNVEAYLHRVAVNTSRHALAAEGQRLKCEKNAAMEANDQRNTGAQCDEWNEVRAHLDEAINRLSKMQRATVLLYYYNGLNQREVAAEFGISRNAVDIHLRRGLEKLRVELSRRVKGLSVAVLAGFLSARSQEAVCPNFLSLPMKKLAHYAESGRCGAISLSNKVTLLAKGTLKMMLWTNLKMAAAMVLALLSCGLTPFAVGVLWAEDAKPPQRPSPTKFEDAKPTQRPSPNKSNGQEGELYNKALGARAATVIRGTCQRVPGPAVGLGKEVPGGGWPTYTMKVTAVFKTPKEQPLKVGAVVTLKTMLSLPKTEATYYLKLDVEANLYRLMDDGMSLKNSVSHIQQKER